MRFIRSALIGVTALVAAINGPCASAQTYPTKPVRVIVQFPPGGTPDIYGRVMSNELSKVWGQSVVVENRVGAGGAIGTDAVAKAAPDGYTLLFAADAPITVSPNLVSKLPYDPVRDLAPIVNVAQGPFVLLAHPSVAAKNLPELIALIKSQPGKWSYASSGTGSQQHLSMEWIRTAANLDMTHVPYKGFGQGVADVMAGQIPIIFGGITAAIGIHRGGKLRALAVTSKTRNANLPDIQAVAETLPGFEILAWYGFMAPAGTPREIIQKINADVVAIVNRADFRERLAKDAIEPVANTPEQFAAQIKADLAAWAKIVKASGAKVE
ncbi:MAG: tripartite tricarboxylate transporter substrate binding protein [Burkholderiales bacterium]